MSNTKIFEFCVPQNIKLRLGDGTTHSIECVCDHLWIRLGNLSTGVFVELSRLKLATVKLGDLTGVGILAGVDADDPEVLFMGSRTLAGIGTYSAS